jgi:hypothetical protein
MSGGGESAMTVVWVTLVLVAVGASAYSLVRRRRARRP